MNIFYLRNTFVFAFTMLFSDTLLHVAGLHINNNVLYACSYQGALSGIVGFDLSTSDVIFHKQIAGMSLPNGITSDASGFLYVTAYISNKIFKINISNEKTNFNIRINTHRKLC